MIGSHFAPNAFWVSYLLTYTPLCFLSPLSMEKNIDGCYASDVANSALIFCRCYHCFSCHLKVLHQKLTFSLVKEEEDGNRQMKVRKEDK